MHIIAIKTPLFNEGEDLTDFIKNSKLNLEEGDILVITSKIVALSQKRTGLLKDKIALIKNESERTIKTPWALLTYAQSEWTINAGIDESNANKQIILLPKDVFSLAENIRNDLKKYFNIKNLGVIITDTRSIPLRVGTIGRAIGFAGFKPLRNYIGKKDLFKRETRLTQSNLADALSAAAVLMMGEGNEQSPLAVIKQPPVEFIQRPLTLQEKQLSLPADKDIYKSIFTALTEESQKSSKRRRRKQ